LTNALTPEQQIYWVRECLTRFPESCFNNLQTHFEIPPETNLWQMRQDPAVCMKRTDLGLPAEEEARKRQYSGIELFDKLRWITMGYFYNWSTKLYQESQSPFPPNLFYFGVDVARVFGIPAFRSEAAFVNYYRYGDTLTGHVDRSEKDFGLPIISASFGQTAVFLIGGETRDTAPVPLFLRSGDIVIMEKDSRVAFHGVPRIVEDTCPLHLEIKDGTVPDEVLAYMRGLRINMNVRQVFGSTSANQ